MTRTLEAIAAGAVITACLATPASAQPGSRFYAGGSVGALSVSADEVDGTSAAGGLIAGMALNRWLDAEAELLLPTAVFTRSYTGIGVSFAPPGSSREEIERHGVTTRFDKRRDVTSSFSAVAIFHPPVVSRWTPGFIAGVTNQRVRDRTDYSPIAVPAGVDPDHPSVRARAESASRNLGALTIGANLSIALTPQLRIVPDVRYDYGSIGDEINNALRMSVRMLWHF